MKNLLIILLLFVCPWSYSQHYTIDTLKNAIVPINSYLPVPVYGYTGTNGIYTLGFNRTFINGKPMPLQVVRIDLTKKEVQYKILPGTLSFSWGLFAMYAPTVFDKYGNYYLTINKPRSTILQINLKDSIQVEDLGNAFMDEGAFTYHGEVGRDGRIYFYKNRSCQWSVYDPLLKKWEKHPEIDTVKNCDLLSGSSDYDLCIAGDSDYIYTQTSDLTQNIRLWCISKKDNTKKILGTYKRETSIKLKAFTDGMYASFFDYTRDKGYTLTGIYRLRNGEMEKVISLPANTHRIDYNEVIKDSTSVKTYFSQAENKLYYSISNKHVDSVEIKTSLMTKKIKPGKLFSFPGDEDNIYYAGTHMSDFGDASEDLICRYNFKTDSAYLIGSAHDGFVSMLARNNNNLWFRGYGPEIFQWDRKLPYTTETYFRKFGGEKNTNHNPKILPNLTGNDFRVYQDSDYYAERDYFYFGEEDDSLAELYLDSLINSNLDDDSVFIYQHDDSPIILDEENNIVVVGTHDVKTSQFASIGVFRPSKKIVFHISIINVGEDVRFSRICLWNKLAIFALTISSHHKTTIHLSKIYFYDPTKNKIVDSLDAGFDDYGKIYVKENSLIGIANNRLYSFDLRAKKLTRKQVFPENSFGKSLMLSNSKILVATSKNIPDSFFPCITIPDHHYHDFIEVNKKVYALTKDKRGHSIIQIKGLVLPP